MEERAEEDVAFVRRVVMRELREAEGQGRTTVSLSNFV